jgi:hypothetical protein
MIGMGAEANIVVRAEAADFFCNSGTVKIPSDERVADVPGGVQYHAQGLGLESFQDFDVGGGSSAPELYTIGPDGFGNCNTHEPLRNQLLQKWQLPSSLLNVVYFFLQVSLKMHNNRDVILSTLCTSLYRTFTISEIACRTLICSGFNSLFSKLGQMLFLK